MLWIFFKTERDKKTERERERDREIVEKVNKMLC